MANTRLASFLHVTLNILQAAAAAAFIQLNLLVLALLVALVGKWRVVSINPYRLWRNIRANSCDIIVTGSTVLLMNFYSQSLILLGILSAFLLIWLVFIKPASGRGAVALQAACCQFFGMSAVWLIAVERGWHGLLVLGLTAAISYSAARHIGLPLGSDQRQERSILPLIWAVLITELGWLAWVWSITYRLPGDFLVPQIALLSTVLGYFSAQYMFAQTGQRRRLPSSFIWAQVFFFVLVLVAIIVLTPWTAR